MKYSGCCLFLFMTTTFLSTTIYASASMEAHDALNNKNYAEAAELLQKEASLGDVESQRLLARMYDDCGGRPLDYQEAAKWYRLAAEQGDALSQYFIGTMYERG